MRKHYLKLVWIMMVLVGCGGDLPPQSGSVITRSHPPIPPMPTDPAIYPTLLLYPEYKDIQQTIEKNGKERITTFYSSAPVEEIEAWYATTLADNGWLSMLGTNLPTYKYHMTQHHFFVLYVDVQTDAKGSFVSLSQGLPRTLSPAHWPADDL